MKISVITPVFNDVRIIRALNSIFEQQLDHTIETIVIDSSSNDSTLNVMEPYVDRIDFLIREPDENLYHGMNKGIRLATGEIVGILNADDRYCDRRVLNDVANVFRSDPKVDICWGNICYVDAHSRPIRYWRSSENSRRRWYFGWRPPHSGFFVRKSIYDRYGRFRVNLSIAADYELQLRLLLKNDNRSAYLDRLLVYMETGGISNRSALNIIKANWESCQAWRLNKLPGWQLVPLMKPLRSVVQFIRPVPIDKNPLLTPCIFSKE